MKPDKQHAERIKQELKAVGMTAYGQHKFASKYLPKVIHHDEHIKAIVYGRYREDDGLLGYSAGMLVATDHRVVFLDHKPGYTHMDEISYDIIAGANENAAGPSVAVTLFTRVGNYTIRFVNSACAQKFVRHIEISMTNRSGNTGSAPTDDLAKS